MKDPVFAGKDVDEAVRVASRTLAVPQSRLRYVVLDPGQPGGRGLSPTEARIAVLIERVVAGGSAESPAARAHGADADVDWDAGRGGRRRPSRGAKREDEHDTPAADDPESSVRAVVDEIARAAGVELRVGVSDGRDGVDVRLEGPGTHVFFDPQGEALAGLEHVLERLYGRALAGRRVRLRCAGYREYRDALLRERALELAQLVRGDGQPRTTGPLNAYERRVIHVTLEGYAGVTTFSVGEGHARRVTVAPQAEGGAAEAQTVAAPVLPPVPAAEAEPRQEAPHDAEPQPALTPAPFDARQFDRPPQGGAPELM